MDSKAMYKLSYGLFVLTTRDGNKDNGCISNTVIQGASAPNQLIVAVNKANLTCETIMSTRAFNVSVIAQGASFELFKRFGFQSGRDVEKFDGFDGKARADNGIYYVTEGTNAYFSARVTETVDLGSHMLFVGEVVDMAVLSSEESMTYAYYHSSVKPKPAPPTSNVGKSVWRCKICGYEFEGDELPEDFVCPICKHPASDFEKVGGSSVGKTVWRCKICGYEYEGDELPEDFVCPICKHPASDFEKVGA